MNFIVEYLHIAGLIPYNVAACGLSCGVPSSDDLNFTERTQLVYIMIFFQTSFRTRSQYAHDWNLLPGRVVRQLTEDAGFSGWQSR